MGKDLKGKELGVGISQRKDGMYTGRFTTRTGKRMQRYFHKLQECRAWIAEAQFEDEHGNAIFSDSPTADAWFRYWLDEVKGDSIKTQSKVQYETRWRTAISPVIGNMELAEIKPIHCQHLLNLLNGAHRISYIQYTKTLLSSVLECAAENELIAKNPISKSVKPTGGKPKAEKEALTVDEQKKFLEHAAKSSKYRFYALALQTGMRCGELSALTWADVDFINRKISVRRSLSYIKDVGFVVGSPKTKSGIREIPLTEAAIRILYDQREKRKENKITRIEYKDFVFLSPNGKPFSLKNCNAGIKTICKNAKIRDISMHILRHTFATRCIEGGMRPKTLQNILGHSTVEMTMNLYVHATEDSKAEEMGLVEQKLKLV